MKINRENLKHQVMKLCEDYLLEDDIVVGVLRFGAHIPHVYRNACLEKSLKPKKIRLLLSHILPFFPKKYYENKKIVLLDDTVYTGTELYKLKKMLINQLGVLENNIQTVTLVAHEDSSFEPDYPKPAIRLRNAEYIAWKEVLGSLVAQDIRPTERDHPLYFFEVKNFELGGFLDILKNYGTLHSVGAPNSEVLKISLTIDSSNMQKAKNLAGVTLSSTYKIRIYLRQDAGNAKFTAVPMGFPVIDINKLIENGGSRDLAKLIGLPEDFYENIYTSYHTDFRDTAVFYYASRSIAAYLLELLIKQITPKVENLNSKIGLLDSREEDGSVKYEFPIEYEIFYKKVFKSLTTAIKNSKMQNLSLFDAWEKPERVANNLQFDPLLPAPYEILGFLAKEIDTAKWDGKKWMPNFSTLETGITYQDLLSEFKDPLFISRSLDYLLESGLLRAKDLLIGKNLFTRIFLPGGEYNAVQVSRLSDMLKFQPPFDFNPAVAEEEAIDLWGSTY